MKTFLLKAINSKFNKIRNAKELIIFIIMLFFILKHSPTIGAATILSDSFSDGYNKNLWYFPPSADAADPLNSTFGIGDTNSNLDVWYRIYSTFTPLPSDEIVKVDIKINSHPSEVILSCKDIKFNFPVNANEKRVFLHSDGNFGLEAYINGGGNGSGNIPWDNSPGIHHLELDCFGTMMTFKEDNITKGTWDDGFTFTPDMVRLDFKNGDSEFANYQLCDDNGCNSPTSTPSPLPPTPTSIPSPDPQATKQVIVIPGMTADWNTKDIVLCTTTPNAPWSLIGPANDTYNPILRRLKKDGWQATLFQYDWRKRVSDNAKLLKSFINSQLKPGEKVDVVAHSMGGLLARSYLELETANNKIDRLLTVGTPHKGSVDSYLTWSAGLPPQTGDPLWRFYVLAIEKFCQSKTLNERIAIQTYFPSIQDLLPTFDYLIDNQTNQLKPVQTMVAKNTWLLNSIFAPPYHDITMGTLSGKGKNTELALRVNPPNQTDKLLGNWQDGKPVQTITTMDGDNRVLLSSSSLPQAKNLGPIDQEHTNLISSQDGINIIMNFLNGPKIAQVMMLAAPLTLTTPKSHIQESTTPTSGLFIIGYPATLWVIDPNEKFYKDTDGLVSIMDPKTGLYKLIFWAKEKETHLAISQILTDDKNLWKEYTFTTRFLQFHVPQIHFLNFSSKHPKEDILH